jgi:iron complex outermembrane receptor protein
MPNHIITTSIAALLMSTTATQALAQDQAGNGIEDIVVTAQKREESLQDTPISIAAFSAQDLENKGINGLTDLRANVPNLQLTPFPNNAATTQIFMRGVGLADDQITQDGGVAVYMDGVYVARSQGLAMEVADLDRIEVLRGPQGTLYGRNATGGAINFITRKPDLGDFGFKGQVTLGNYDNRRFKAAVNVPIGQTIAVRLSYVNQQQDGFIRNPGTGVKRWGDKDRQAMRADLLWQPSDAFSLRYNYDRTEIGDTPTYVALSPLHPRVIDRPKAGSPLVRDLLANDITAEGHSLTGEWQASDALTVRSITGYRKLDNFQNQDYLTGALGPFPLQKNSSLAKQDQWSEELQLIGDTLDGQLQYVAGFYYFSESGSNFSNSYSPPTLTRSFTTATIDNRSYALFGQATFTPQGLLDRRLHFTVGLRQSWDKREATLARQSQVNGGPIVTIPGTGDGSRTFKDFSPSVVVAFDASDDVNLYAKAVKGYKSGGYNVRASSIGRFDEGFGPETLWSYEAGVKSEWLDNRLRFNAAGFISKYSDIQVNVQSDPTNIRLTDVLNAGRATVKGVEMDLTLAPVRDLRLSVNYGYLLARYKEIIDATGANIAANYRFTNAPKHSIALDLTYDLRLPVGQLSANLNYTAQSDKYTNSTVTSGKYIIGDYGLLNARLTLTDIPGVKGVRASLWGRNLTDKNYYVMQFNVGRPGALFGEPRTYGIDLSVEF